LKELVQKVINKVYIEQDYDYFRLKCKQGIQLTEEFYNLLATLPRYIEMGPSDVSPSKEWYVYFDKVAKEKFILKYNTVIKISKIAQVYYVQHEFEVENQDENRMGPVLDGYSGEAYCRQQFDFHERIRQCMISNGFIELSYAEMNEVIFALSMPKGRTIFGSQMTVETALFRDVFEICPDE